MNKNWLLFTFLISLNLFAAEVDLSKSSFKWTGKKVTGQHYGKISLKKAEMDIKEGKLLGGKFVMDMKSMTVEDLQGEWEQKFIAHMHSTDFFNTSEHPTATLEILTSSDNKVSANLSIRGKTKKVDIDFKKSGNTYSGKMIFDRTKFDIKYKSGNFFKDLGDKLIYDDVTLEFKVLFK